LAWDDRAASKGKVLLQFGKNPAGDSSRVETQNAEETGLRPARCIVARQQGVSSQKEARLNGKTYSRRDEKRILDVLGRGLLKDYPNPERIGCPGADVLKRIASHEMPLSEADKWLDHLGSCSPCYADFKRFAETHEWQRRRTWLAAAAGIILAVSVGGWAWFHKHNGNLVAETAVLDLRDRSPARGTEANPTQPPLEVSRRVAHLKIYLPIGSSEGDYDIRIVASEGRPLFAATGVASAEQGVATLAVEMRLSSASPGIYVLQLQRVGSEWTSYPLQVK
jgi:hypothetical protein